MLLKWAKKASKLTLKRSCAASGAKYSLLHIGSNACALTKSLPYFVKRITAKSCKPKESYESSSL